MDDDGIDHNHPRAGRGLPEREAIGFLIYGWDSAAPEDRTRSDYLTLADRILQAQRDHYGQPARRLAKRLERAWRNLSVLIERCRVRREVSDGRG
ncbi:hypothetical protein [Micromonospora sp. NPDC049662]|uniref:hypothetical protein n=1 Tax=Micromonospora sp. NPDC049662 TaxID=3155397 RepID=UPI003435A45E